MEEFFSDNIKTLNNWIGKFIKVTLIEEREESGYVYVIDPVSETLVLVVNDAEKSKFVIVPKHVILDVVVTSEPKCTALVLADKPKNLENVEELKRKRDLLKAWFEKRKVFLEVDGLNLILGPNVTIKPPYATENILVHSTIAFENIKSIIDEMPTDFQA